MEKDEDIPKGNQVLSQFDNDFDKIANNLQIMSRRLVLLNPELKTKPKNKKKKMKSMHKKGKGSTSQPVLETKFDKENEDQNALKALPAPENNDKGSY